MLYKNYLEVSKCPTLSTYETTKKFEGTKKYSLSQEFFYCRIIVQTNFQGYFGNVYECKISKDYQINMEFH